MTDNSVNQNESEKQGVAEIVWNDQPKEWRLAMMPHTTDTHILHLRQTRGILVRNHKKALAEIDEWIDNLTRSAAMYRQALHTEGT